MQTPCAYCKEFGHHIRVCELLEAKNRRQKSLNIIPAVDGAKPRIPPSIINVKITCPFPVTKTKNTKTSKNAFSELYSSDDEIEDGEIVEENRFSHETPSGRFSGESSNSYAHSSLWNCPSARVAFVSDSESSCGSVSKSDSKWSRSGIKGIQLPVCQSIVTNSDSEEEYPCIYYEDLAVGMEDFVKRFRGRSWVDIEYDSDLE